MNYESRNQNRTRKLHAAILLFSVLCLFFFASCSPRVYRVGVLSGLNFFAETTNGFKAGMTDLGYIEGKNITYDVQKTDFDMAAYERILKDFVKEKVDLILAFPTEASQQAKEVTKGTKVPVVFTNAFTEETGLVNTVQEPGGNITGVRWPGPEIVARCSEILMELVPHAKRMIVAYQKGYPIVRNQLDVVRPIATAANITLIEIPANSPSELEGELQKLKGPFDKDIIHMMAEPLVTTPEGYGAVAKFAARYNIPIGGSPVFEGEYQSVFGLMPDPTLQGKQAASLADKIFKGTPPAKLPVVTAEYFFLFNYRQALKLKLNVTERMLSQADKVIR